jgi:murein DD-endopeptidase MepM/ murein hydrolase activator NlpD
MSWPGERRSGSDPLYQRVPHLLIVAIAIAMVLGGGFWNRDQSVLMPGGTDMIQSVSSPLFTNGTPSTPSTQNLVASTSDNILDGYLSTSSLSVTPQQLGIEIYVTYDGHTIADVAAETGRSEDTLLWANDYRDTMQELPAGTQLRIPPTDGMLHMVGDGDTLENIAERYGVTPEDITGYAPNGVEHSADLVPNRMIMVPGGSMPMRDEVIFYTVRHGDALWQIADRFGLKPQTILWTNSLSNADVISPGQQLAILPTDGVMVEVDAGDTVESLAQEWSVEASAIRDWPANGLGADGSLIVGQSVMIPGGSPPAPPEPEPQPDPPAVASQPQQPAQSSQPVAQPAPQPTPTPAPPSRGTGRFIWPTTGVITQYFHSAHNGWDIANRMYTQIWAADGGTVIFSGWNNYGLGYAVAIDHGNGFVTWYGHMAEHPPVRVGQWVNQGQYIGPMGSTGYSTGPHVHFVIAYNGVYQNPGNYLR